VHVYWCLNCRTVLFKLHLYALIVLQILILFLQYIIEQNAVADANDASADNSDYEYNDDTIEDEEADSVDYQQSGSSGKLFEVIANSVLENSII